MSIYIFSKPIRSGKTTELMDWCNQHNNIAGILMPDINGYRKMYNIQTKEVFDAVCPDGSKTSGPLTVIGKFTFFSLAFEKANQVISSALKQTPDWLIIDEAGKLELKGEGFYSSVAEAVHVYSNTKKEGNLLIIIRDSLCDEVIRYFGISQYTIIDSLTLLL